ncbi:MAG: PAS domain-containing protein, partial [Planctomycetota bacterium]
MRDYDASNDKPAKETEGKRSSRGASGGSIHDVSNREGPVDLVEKALDELETIFNTTKDSIMLIDSDFQIVQANAATLDFLGKSLDEMIGQKCYKLIHEADLPAEVCPLERAKQTKSHEQAELYIPRKDMWVTASVDPILDEKGNVIKAVHIIRDVTARRRMEEALQESEEKFREISEQSVMGIVIIQDYMFKYANQAVSDIFEYSVEEMLHWGPKECYSRIVHPDDIPFVMEQARRRHVGEKGVVVNYAWKAVTKRGKTKCVETYSKPISFGGKGADLVTMIDISDSRRAEEELRKSEASYREIFDAANDAIFVHDPETGAVLDVNRRMCEMFGYSRGEARRLSVEDLSSGEAPYTQEEALRRLNKVVKGKPEFFEWRCKNKALELFWGEVGLKRVVLAGKERILAVVRDITKRKKAEAALRESEARFRQVVENAQEWIWEVDVTGLYTYASPVVEKILGYKPEEIVGKKHFYDLFHPEERDELKNTAFEVFAESQTFREFVNRNMHKNGEMVWLSTSGVPVFDEAGNLLGYRGADTNITDRRRAEQRILEHEAQLKSLASELSLAEERERRRLAIEVHDRISQSLGISKIRLDELRKSVSSKKVAEVLNEVCNSLSQAIGGT